MEKPRPVWWHSRTRWPEDEGTMEGRFWKPGHRGFDGFLYEETHAAEPLYDQKTVDSLIAKQKKSGCSAVKRMWINQPSKEQPYHDLHGTNVLAIQDYYDTYRVYFLSGHVVSSQIYRLALSPGWRDKE